MGELTHPEDREEIALDRVAVMMPEPPVKDDKGNLIGYVDILDTPAGRIAYQLAKYGYKFGISSRGTGDIIEGLDGDEVDPETYQLNAFDLVEIPAVESARLTFTESLDKKRYNKTLRQTLNEELEKASDSDKKIMEDALDNLGINLDESKGEYIGLDDIDADKYPSLYDALDLNAVSLIKYGDAITNEQFDTQLLEENDVDIVEVKNDIRRYCEHNGLEFKFDGDKSESVEEDCSKDEELDLSVDTKDARYYQREFDDIYHNVENLLKQVAEDPELGMESNIYQSLSKVFDELDDKNETIEEDNPVNEEVPNDVVLKRCKELMNLLKNSEELSYLYDDAKEIYDTLSSGKEWELKEEDETPEEGSDKDEVVDDQSEEDGIVAEFQEALARVKQLEADNLSLQEKLSVCNAKESELKSRIAKYKEANAKLSESYRKSKELKKTLNEKDVIIADNKQIIEKLSKSELGAKQELSKVNSQLDESKASNRELTNKINSLNEKLAKSQELVGKYKKSYAALKESYLDVKARNYGLKKDEVKQKLGESYKIKDIDDICESLNTEKTNMSKLPFRIDENVNIKVKPQKEYIKGSISMNEDDYISDTLRRMIQ